MSSNIRPANEDAIAEAAAILRAGGVVAMPTETVYGLAGDATNPQAVARIYEAKNRPHLNPLIAHVRDLEMARGFGALPAQGENISGVIERRFSNFSGNFAKFRAFFADLSPQPYRLAEKFWPGPLTLVVRRFPPLGSAPAICDLAAAGLETLALRSPAHPVAQALIRAADRPLAAPSANPSGRLSPTTADAVAEMLGDKVDLILDGGPCEHGVESTIVACIGGAPQILRPGTIPRETLAAAIGAPMENTKENKPMSPGSAHSHYAPNAAVRLNASQPEGEEAFLGFGETCPEGALNLSPAGDLREAAANLYTYLRRIDSRGVRSIAVAPVPNNGLGEAINDRLARASAPRPR